MAYKLNRERILATFRIGVNSTVLAFAIVGFFVLAKFGVIHLSRAIPERANNAILLAFLLASFVCGPPLLLLWQYIHYSRGVELSLNKDKEMRTLVIKRDGHTITIVDTEIEIIKKICSLAVSEKRVNFIATDPIYYYKIYTSKGDRYIIPCTVVGDELKDFYHDKIRVVPKFMAFISK